MIFSQTHRIEINNAIFLIDQFVQETTQVTYKLERKTTKARLLFVDVHIHYSFKQMPRKQKHSTANHFMLVTTFNRDTV